MEPSILRLRPSAVLADGYKEERLRDLARTLTGEDAAPVTIPISIAASADDPDQVRLVADLITAATDEPGLLIVDLAFTLETVRGISLCDVLLSNALSIASQHIHADSKILVLLEGLPTDAEDLSTLVDDPFLAAKLIFVDADFNTSGNHGLIDAALVAETLQLEFVDQVDGLKRSTLRRRGVFEYRPTTDHVSHYLFHYDPLHQARPLLIELLRNYFIRTGCEIVLFESTFSGDWFSSCVQSACLGYAASIDSRDLTNSFPQPRSTAEEQRRSSAIEMLRDKSRNLCCIVPAFRTGGSLFNLFEQTGRRPFARTKFMSIFIDEARTSSTDPRDHLELSWGQMVYKLEYLMSVPMRGLAADNWKVSAALELNEVERPGGLPFAPGEDINPTETAMLSLFEDYGADVESPVPSGRSPISYFPQLGRLDKWDAFWLAEAAVRRAVTIRRCAREGLLVVIPDEDNGSSPIADALAERCVTAVLRIPRDVIDGRTVISPKARTALETNSASTILLLDESTVTRGTLLRMRSLVESIVGRRPRTMAAIVDLGPDDLNDGDFFSFAAWRPILTTGTQ